MEQSQNIKEVCPHTQVPCDQCQQQVIRQEMSLHIKDICSLSPIKCLECSTEYFRKDKNDHKCLTSLLQKINYLEEENAAQKEKMAAVQQQMAAFQEQINKLIGMIQAPDQCSHNWVKGCQGKGRKCLKCQNVDHFIDHKWQDSECIGRICSICNIQDDGYSKHIGGKWLKGDAQKCNGSCKTCGDNVTKPHNWLTWEEKDQYQCIKTCSDCQHTKEKWHNYAGWLKIDSENCVGTCSACSRQSTRSHFFSQMSEKEDANYCGQYVKCRCGHSKELDKDVKHSFKWYYCGAFDYVYCKPTCHICNYEGDRKECNNGLINGDGRCTRCGHY